MSDTTFPTQLTLSGFKPFAQSQAAPLAPITLLYGPNSGGKTSIIQALLLLKQRSQAYSTATSGLVLKGPLVDCGTFESVAHRHDRGTDVSMSLRVSGGQSLRFRFRTAPARITLPLDASSEVSVRFHAAPSTRGRRGHSSYLASVRLRLDATSSRPGLDASLRAVSGRRRSQDADLFEWADRDSVASMAVLVESLIREMVQRQRQPLRGLPKDLPSLAVLHRVLGSARAEAEMSSSLPAHLVAVRGSGKPDSPVGPDVGDVVLRVAEGLLHSLGSLHEDAINSLDYLGPLRMSPARYYRTSGEEGGTVGVAGERTPDVLLSEGRDLRKNLHHWFERFQLPYELRVARLGNALTGELLTLSLVDQRAGVAVSTADVGFGIAQVLPILVEGLIGEGSLICVEQPELHLHPRLQADLADFFISTSGIEQRKRDSVDAPNRWLVETHSEALMLRFQRRVRQGSIRPSDISVLYVEPRRGGSRIHQLRLDDRGDFLDEWPHGFFEERFDEVFGE